jgi:hypothetical protein
MLRGRPGKARGVLPAPSIPRSAYVNIDPPEGADLDYIDRSVQTSGNWPFWAPSATNARWRTLRRPPTAKMGNTRPARGNLYEPDPGDHQQHRARVCQGRSRAAAASVLRRQPAQPHRHPVHRLRGPDQLDHGRWIWKTIRERVRQHRRCQDHRGRAGGRAAHRRLPSTSRISGTASRCWAVIAQQVKTVVEKIPMLRMCGTTTSGRAALGGGEHRPPEAALFGLTTEPASARP